MYVFILYHCKLHLSFFGGFCYHNCIQGGYVQIPYMKMFSIRRRTKMSKAISRRNFLMATGAVGAAGLLAACGSKPAASSTASSAAASQAPAASADESLALSDGPVNLSISWWGGDSRHAAYQSALEAFQAEHSNITVEPTFAAWGSNRCPASPGKLYRQPSDRPETWGLR